jgi:hypothetical protein
MTNLRCYAKEVTTYHIWADRHTESLTDFLPVGPDLEGGETSHWARSTRGAKGLAADMHGPKGYLKPGDKAQHIKYIIGVC